MATYGWRKSRSVTEGLAEEGHRFSFFQAVRLLELLHPDRAAVGESVDPEEESVRFSSRIRFDFPATEVDAVEISTDGREPSKARVNFLGIAGVLGPLPPPFTEMILEQQGRKKGALSAFLDLFNHRLLSIFYRARKKFRPALTRRRPDEGAVARALFALIGLATPGLRGRLGLPDRCLLRYCGLLVGRSRSMIGLQRMIQGQFGIRARVIPFQGSWMRLDASQHTLIGLRGKNHRLGESVVLGQQVWDQQAGFELDLPDLTQRQLVDFLPSGAGYSTLCSLVRYYVGDELDFRLHLRIRPGEVPELRLGQAGDGLLGWSARLIEKGTAELRLGSSGGGRLGWTSWLASGGASSVGAQSFHVTLRGNAA